MEPESNATKPICPKCGSTNVVSIVYGLPMPELFEKAERGEVMLGGCCVSADNPTQHCKDCEHSWRASRNL